VDPNLTAVAPKKPVPVTVNVVPPPVGPVTGVNEVMVGTGAMYRKLPLEVAVPPGVVTDTLTVPATWGSVVALIWEGLKTV
jgi:hypothetical protein